MSTTSATTALAARDHIRWDVADLSNRMCLFALTKGDDTPFNASSIPEEDIIELCIWFGHPHPEGVIQYSVIELVILLHTTDELQIMMHGVIKASALCEEAIRVRTSSPSVAHVWAYMAAVTGKPHLFPSNPHAGGRTLQHLQANLGDLVDNMLQQLMEKLCREIALLRAECTPRNPPQTPWGNPMENGVPNVDDQGVTFLRGEGWVPPEQPFQTPAPAQPDGAWRPRGQPPHPQHLFNLMRM